ncbi:hypothetical protein [Anabaena azotica]|nr:hypothetical protein [Anabaena azotica]
MAESFDVADSPKLTVFERGHKSLANNSASNIVERSLLSQVE